MKMDQRLDMSGKVPLLLAVLLLGVSLCQVEAQRVRTTRSCENSRYRLGIMCYGGGTMQIVSAMWGRMSLWTCRTGNYRKTGCRETVKATATVKRLCNAKTTCRLSATTALFGEPCKGVSKYIEIKYKCTPPPTPPTIGPATKSACDNRTKADIYFLVDSSGSVGTYNYVHLLRFVNSLINNLAIGMHRVRVGLIRFSSRVQLHIPLNRYYNKAALRQAVRYIPYISGGTATSSVLNNMRTVGFTGRNGARAGVPKIGILISDGSPNSMTRTLQEAARCKAAGIEIFCVAAQAPRRARAQIAQIASKPTKSHSFIVDKFPQMTMKAPPVANVICKKLAKSLPTTTTTTTIIPTTTITTTTTTTSKCPAIFVIHKKWNSFLPFWEDAEVSFITHFSSHNHRHNFKAEQTVGTVASTIMVYPSVI
ncbi:collagen alpha-1(XIV) chain-like [Lineus longissimus]|uniref:collagen alpha-1(XIV) chain-like n=1 Tax=Lineus longissimus TaxID=88925 RepID=UPI00315CACC4